MIHSITEFEKLAYNAIVQLSFEQKCAYCAWCVKRLYTSYATLLPLKLSAKQARLTTACHNHIVKAVETRTFSIKSSYKDRYTMLRIDLDFDLNFEDSEEQAILKLAEAIDITLRFIATKNNDLVILMPLMSLQIIDTILTNEYGLDTSEIDKVIGHELLQREFMAQLNTLRTI